VSINGQEILDGPVQVCGLDGSREEDDCEDQDGDGACDEEDNCVGVYNPHQKDCDLDGVGDDCDPDSLRGCDPEGNWRKIKVSPLDSVQSDDLIFELRWQDGEMQRSSSRKISGVRGQIGLELTD